MVVVYYYYTTTIFLVSNSLPDTTWFHYM